MKRFQKILTIFILISLLASIFYSAVQIAAEVDTNQTTETSVEEQNTDPANTENNSDPKADDVTINQLKEELEEQREELKRIKGLKERIETDSEDLKKRMGVLKDTENEQLGKLKEIEEQLDQAQETLEEKLEAYEETKKEYIKKQEMFDHRLVNMFFVRKKSPIELLIESKGIGGFFKSLKMVGIMAHSDKAILDSIKIAREMAKEQERVARSAVNEFDAFYQKKKQEIDEISRNIEGANTQISALESELQDVHLSEEKAQESIAEKERAYLSYMQKQKNYDVQFAGGNGIWPLPAANGEISSPFGYRGGNYDTQNGGVHTGVDFSGPNVVGSPVLAAWAGIVVEVVAPAPGAVYAPQANYVKIKHGDGISTSYWHLKDINVSEGQAVVAGEVIGTCGSTGMSTGPHLHFELHLVGRGVAAFDTVDPIPYLNGSETF